jgi:hypothetical protein
VDRETKEGEGEAEMRGVEATEGTTKQRFWTILLVRPADRGEDAALRDQTEKNRMNLQRTKE